MIDGVCEKFHNRTALIAGMWSSIPRQLALSPMMILARREHPLDVAVQCPHDADARHHRRAPVAFGDQDQDFNGSRPLLDLLFGLRQLLDISGGVFERDELATARQGNPLYDRAGLCARIRPQSFSLRAGGLRPHHSPFIPDRPDR